MQITSRAAGYTGSPRLAGLKVWTSVDGGGSWQAAQDVDLEGDGRHEVTVRHPELADTDGYVALKLEPWDAAGNRTTQEIMKAYALRLGRQRRLDRRAGASARRRCPYPTRRQKELPGGFDGHDLLRRLRPTHEGPVQPGHRLPPLPVPPGVRPRQPGRTSQKRVPARGRPHPPDSGWARATAPGVRRQTALGSDSRRRPQTPDGYVSGSARLVGGTRSGRTARVSSIQQKAS